MRLIPRDYTIPVFLAAVALLLVAILSNLHPWPIVVSALGLIPAFTMCAAVGILIALISYLDAPYICKPNCQPFPQITEGDSAGKNGERVADAESRDELVQEMRVEQDIAESTKSPNAGARSILSMTLRTSSLRALGRIDMELVAISRRANVSLMLSLLGSLAATIGLLFLFDHSYTNDSTLTDIVKQALPTLSMVVIVQFFSFFHLRLYKGCLDEIKFFQNEATNIENQFVGLETAISWRDKDLVADAVRRLLSTERNPLLKSGVSTRELESTNQVDKLLRMFPELVIEMIRTSKDGEKSKP